VAYDLYPAVDEDLKFAPEVRAANASTPEFRSQVVPMTQTARNNLTGDELWDNRLIFNTTTDRIDRYDEGSTTWLQVTSEPAGIIKEYGGDTAPAYHVMADGGLVSRTGIYANLFSVFGTKYNIGSGGEDGTNFRLPNRKGKTAVGLDVSQTEFNALGKTGGEKTHTLTVAELAAHDHGNETGGQSAQHQHGGTTGGNNQDHSHNTRLKDTAYTQSGGSLTKSYEATTPGDPTYGASNAHDHNFATGNANTDHSHDIPAQGGGTAHNNLQPFITMNFIITL
jgi:microcystin-dependent protein